MPALTDEARAVVARGDPNEMVSWCHDLLDEAERHGRYLTADERAEYDQVEHALRDATKRESGREAVPRHGGETTYSEPLGGPRLRTADGDELRTLTANERLSERVWTPGSRTDSALDHPHPIGEALRSLIAGDNSKAATAHRDQVIESAIGGGFLLDDDMSPLLIDQARAQSAVMNAGAVTVPLNTTHTLFVTVDSDPQAGWRAELEDLPKSQIDFGQIEMVPATLGCEVEMSIELAEDGVNAAAVIEQTLSNAIGNELDRRWLRGELQGGHSGILDSPNANRINTARSQLSYDHILQGKRDVAEANGQAVALINTPRDQHNLETSKDANNQYLTPPQGYTELRRLTTTQIPTDADHSGGGNNDESAAVVGNMQSAFVLAGVRRELTVETSREAAFHRLGVVIRIWGRFALAIGRPKHLTVIDGLIA